MWLFGVFQMEKLCFQIFFPRFIICIFILKGSKHITHNSLMGLCDLLTYLSSLFVAQTLFFFSNDEMSCFGTKLFMRVGRRWDHSTACPRGSGAKHLHQTHLLWCHRLDRNKMTEVLSFLIHNEPRWFRFIASNDLN